MNEISKGPDLLKNINLLLVDDDAENRVFLVNLMLEMAPTMSVLVAKDGKQALTIIQKKAIDIILLDWEMPNMNGLEVLLVLQEHDQWKYIPVLMYTGAMTDTDHLSKALQYGAVDFLRKPAEPIELMARIQSALYQKKLEVERREIEKKIIQQKNSFLEQSNQLLHKETNDYLLMLARKNEIISKIEQQCLDVEELLPKKFRNEISRFIKQSNREDDYWKGFLNKLNQTDSEFVQRLTLKHSNLTPNEIKVCALIRFGIDTKNIANLLQISIEGIKKSRYRIRKKIELSNIKLDQYILSL